MKKSLKFMGVTFASMFCAINNVSATDLSGQIELSSGGLGDSITFKKTYDETKDVNNVLVTLLVDENNKNIILNQKSGSGSTLSIFYFTLDPKLTGVDFKKNLVWIGDNLTHKTFDSAMNTLESSIDGESVVSHDEIWPNALTVQYSTDGGNTWLTSDKEGDGSTTIQDDLLAKLSLSNPDDLVYGENYRFSMYDEYTQLWGWDTFDSNGDSLGREYVAVNWEIKFPVSGKIGKEQILFSTLEEAIEAGSSNIFINENLTVNSDVVIPENVSLVVSDGITLEIKEGNTFTNNGTVLGTVKSDGVSKTYSAIEVNNAENGIVSVDKTIATNGDIITVTTNANDGYKLKSIEVIDVSNDKVVEVENNEFVMPNGKVLITAVFEKNVGDVMPPQTSDNIMLYVILGIIGFFASILNIKKLHKINNQ